MPDTVTGAEFNRSPSKVKRRASREPVVVTDNGRPVVVVVPWQMWRERFDATLARPITEVLAQPAVDVPAEVLDRDFLPERDPSPGRDVDVGTW